MNRTISANLDASGKRLVLLAARWNDFITQRLVDGAADALLRHGADAARIEQVWVPGSFEVPLAAQALARSGRYDAVVCLGCLLRGQTAHYDLIAAEVAKGIAQVALATGVPVTFGVITADTLEQAVDRCGGKHGHKGAEAALAAVEMVNVLAAIGRQA
ncbi:MAG TPA: 6,7-dimethyl-8-ribityllumazine synthase [Phycisphaerae bacterium]|nr:6,7-dimethyl-8-ribityllumazine synthase [Phycisphaerae bacterium]